MKRESSRYLLSPDTPFTTAIEWLMGGLLLFAPLAFGATQAWSQEIIIALVAVMCVCVVGERVTDRSTGFVWSPAYLFIAAFLILCAAQLLPLSASLVQAISPATMRARSSLLRGVPDVESTLTHTTLSLYPYGTWQQLRLVLAVAALFAVVLHAYRDAERIKRLLLTITCVGLAVGSVAAYQNLSGATTIYGVVPMMHRNSGPFMNYSHFGQFMNLSIGAALGLLLAQLARILRQTERFDEMWHALRERRPIDVWIAAALCIAGPILVCLSMTRMGIFSMLISGSVVIVMIALRGRQQGNGKGSIVIVLGLLAFCVLLYFGFDAVFSRVATVRQFDVVAGGRTQILKDTWAAFKVFPILGTGLGTYEFVYPIFDRLNVASIATHAENEYAQLLSECGAVGLGLAVCFIAVVLVSYFRVVWKPVRSIEYAVFGLGFGLLAILLHSGSDFGQHVPANALLTTVSTALILNLASAKKHVHRADAIPATGNSGRRRFALLACAGIALVAIAVPTLLGADRDRRAEQAWTVAQQSAADLSEINWQGSDDDFIHLLSTAAEASGLRPDNVTYRYWLNVYRWRTISQNIDPQTGRMMITPEIVDFSNEIIADLQTARVSCPSFGPPLSVIGQLKMFVLNDAQGANDVRLAYQLTPYDAMVCMIVGAVEAQQNRWDEALAAYQRYVHLGGGAPGVIDALLHGGKPQLAYTIAHDRRANLQYLSEQLRKEGNEPQLARQCDAEAYALLLAEAQRPDASSSSLADLAGTYKRQGEDALAIDYYHRALDLNYGQVEWRMQLAASLGGVGRYAEATRELQLCLRQRPKMPEAESMLAQYASRRSIQNPAMTPGGEVTNATPP